MTLQEFREQAFAAALRQGCDAAETYAVDGDSFTVYILDGQVDQYVSSRDFGVGVRVLKDGKNGYAYTESLDDPEAVVAPAIDNAVVIESDDEHPMQTRQEYVTVTERDNPVMAMTEREKIDLALRMEQAAKALDPRVRRMVYDVVSTSRTTVHLHNTLGLCAEQTVHSSDSYLAPLLQEGEEMRDGGAARYDEEVLDVDGIAAEAVREAAAMFGAEPVPAGEYAVVLRHDAATSLLGGFSEMFSADDAQKGLSLLAGKEGEVIASPLITIIDDPLYFRSPRAFDDEGTPSVTKAVVENGVLKTLLHNLKTAKKAGVASTSNAVRSPASPIGVAPSNFYIPAGERSFDELVAAMGDGLILTEVSGLHAGLNTVSGDFSLLAKCFLVKDGKVVRPVERITAAGSFIPLLCGVEEVGSDLRFEGSFGSPSLRLKSLMISGQ